MSKKIILSKENKIEVSKSEYNQRKYKKIVKDFLNENFNFILTNLDSFFKKENADAIEFEIDNEFVITFIKNKEEKNNRISITFYLKKYDSKDQRQILIDNVYLAPRDIDNTIFIKEILLDLMK